MPSSDSKELRPLSPFAPVSPLQLRVAKQIFGLTATDVQAIMRSYDLHASTATFWRAEQSSSLFSELQAQMRRVYEQLGLVFYENHAVGFLEENAPTKEELEREQIPTKITTAIRNLRAQGNEPELRSMLIRRIDGERITRPGRQKTGRVNAFTEQNTTEKAK